MSKIVETPLMRQYAEMKRKHPDAVLLFRVGDFYETYSTDAVTASQILGITLTRRANGAAQHVEMAGFPHHALDTYLPRLVRAGKRVAICEQLEDPKLAKKLVKRGITELVTPGVAMGDNVLDHRQNNFLCSVASQRLGHEAVWGVAFLDISTGEFLTAQGDEDYVRKLIASMQPKEVLTVRGTKADVKERMLVDAPVFELEDWIYTSEAARERLMRQFGTASLKGFGVDAMTAAVVASGAIMHYLDITGHTQVDHITALRPIEGDKYVRLDEFTVRNLELLEPLNRDGMSLLQVLDHASSPMGARTLRRWLCFPLRDAEAINQRLDSVQWLKEHPSDTDQLADMLQRVGDLERLASKVAQRRVNPRELLAIRSALELIPPIQQMLSAGPEPLQQLGRALNPLEALCDIIEGEVNPEAPTDTSKGQVIASGVNDELDELRHIAFSGKDYLMEIRRREAELTGISSLKIGYNSVFGYFLEVTNTHRDKVPAQWIRRQTLTNAERYITPELKDYEHKILTAQERIKVLEASLYTDLVNRIAAFVPQIGTNARALGRLDVFGAFARVAQSNNYVRPEVDDSLILDLQDARHPVIEQRLPPGDPYIANSVHLDPEDTQIMMITGPNMSGKSALLRQTALNVIMAQMGCFVAARKGRIGVVDKIFTRVGASDNISLGESTFMVEMLEAAAILNSMTGRSLVLFDELGRGTSTYDGISIAQAIVEHIHNNPQAHPKTLFATHYHELNELAETLPRIHNFNVTVKDIGGKVVFMRRLEPGGAQHSFGIHVARLAGMPRSITARADEILHWMESKVKSEERSVERAATSPGVGTHRGASCPTTAPVAGAMQMSLFQLDDPVLSQVRDEILGLDLNNLTPLQAINKLHDIRAIITGRE